MSTKDRVRPRIDPEVCDGCGLCVSHCASGALFIREGVVCVADDVDCLFCGECEVSCEAGAIARVYHIEFERRAPASGTRTAAGGSR